MTPPKLSSIRNIGIVAHIDAGKTTVSERILYYSGIEHRLGEVHEGTAVMDWMEEERRRGITITAAATTVQWNGAVINLVDTPGHVDFTIEVERCMRVLDGAILVLNGVAGLQAQTETVWRQMKRHEVPYIAFVNQCDRAGADFMRCIGDLKHKLNEPAIALQYPLGEERGFRAVVDLIERQVFEFREEDLGRTPIMIRVPESIADEVDVLRAELIETLAEEDEELLSIVAADEEPTPELLRRALRTRVLARTLVPVFCGAALRNVGVQPLLDAVAEYLPSPVDLPAVRGVVPKRGGDDADADYEQIERAAEPEAPLAALAFKLVADPNEDLTFVRIYAGTLTPGQRVYNPRTGKEERVARVMRMHADERQPLESAGPGEIVALSGLKSVATGDTLCARQSPIVLERLETPEAVLTKVVEPDSTADRDRLRVALDRLAVEDPSFSVREDLETGQWLIAGMGELHLEVIQHRLERDFHLAIHVGRPRVAFREAVEQTGRGQASFDRNIAGKQHRGRIELELLRDPDGPGVELEWSPDCSVPAAYRPAIEEGLLLAAASGPRFGFPLTQARIRVLSGAGEGASDSELGYTQAAAQALRQATETASIALLEPLMDFDIAAPVEFMGGIIAELNSKRANIAEVTADGDLRMVTGQVPLANMFGYSTILRSLSQGRASFSLQPSGFCPIPEGEIEARGLSWS